MENQKVTIYKKLFKLLNSDNVDEIFAATDFLMSVCFIELSNFETFYFTYSKKFDPIFFDLHFIHLMFVSKLYYSVEEDRDFNSDNINVNQLKYALEYFADTAYFFDSIFDCWLDNDLEEKRKSNLEKIMRFQMKFSYIKRCYYLNI